MSRSETRVKIDVSETDSGLLTFVRWDGGSVSAFKGGHFTISRRAPNYVNVGFDDTELLRALGMAAVWAEALSDSDIAAVRDDLAVKELAGDRTNQEA